MVETPQFLSIWDLAHHWYELPVPLDNVALAPRVRDMVTNLLEAVLNGSVGMYEPIIVDPDDPKLRRLLHMEPLRKVPPEIEELYLSGDYQRKLLAYFRLSVESVFMWAASGGGPVPDFCIPEWAYRESSSPVPVDPLRPEVEDRLACQGLARRKWSADPWVRIADMARDPEILRHGNGRLYVQTTLLKWLRDVAPSTVKGKPGRPPKKTEPKT